MKTRIIAYLFILIFLCLSWNRCLSEERQSWAVCIDGNVIGEYEFGAEVKRALLAGDWKESHIRLVAEKSANALFDALEWLSEKTRETDAILFYFTGHGYIGGIEFGTDKITYEQLNNEFEKLRGTQICIILDACHSGTAIPYLKKEDRVVITSCQGNETSGYFSEALINALGPPADCHGNLDGYASAEEVFSHILADWYIDTYTPQLSDSFEGNFTILSTYWEGKKPEVYQVHDQQHLDIFGDHKLLRQSFIPLSTPITGIALKIVNWKTSADILVEIYDENSSVLGQATLPVEKLATLAKSAWIFVDTNISIIPGKKYYIVCKSNTTYWWWGSNDWYSDGEAWASFDQGFTWQLHSQISDFSFIIYGLRDNIPPKVTFISPQRGKIASGILPITWSVEDNIDQNLNGSITLLCSPDGGTSWNTIVSGFSNQGQFQWNTSQQDDGTKYMVKITAVDESRNIGVNVSNGVFTIDNTAPVTMMSSVPLIADGDNGWFQSDVTVALTALDNISGVKASMYRLNNGIWQEYIDIFSFSSGGIHKIIFYSVDHAGNLEKSNNSTIKIDRTDPLTTCILEPKSPTGENKWYVGNVTVTLSSTDDVSGVDRTIFTIDNGETKNYEAPVRLVKEGEYTLYYSSIDKAGNEEDQKTLSVKLDKTKPIINITIPEQGLYIFGRKILPLYNKIFIIGKITITVDSYDRISDINRVCFYSDGQRYNDSTAPYECLLDEPTIGARTLTVFAYDNAGMVETDEIDVIIINI